MLLYASDSKSVFMMDEKYKYSNFNKFIIATKTMCFSYFSMGLSWQETLEWFASSSSRGSSQSRDQTCVSSVSWIGRQILYHWATWEVQDFASWYFPILFLTTFAWMPLGWHCSFKSLSKTSNHGVIQFTSRLPSSLVEQANNSISPGTGTDNPFKITAWIMPTSYPDQI